MRKIEVEHNVFWYGRTRRELIRRLLRQALLYITAADKA